MLGPHFRRQRQQHVGRAVQGIVVGLGLRASQEKRDPAALGPWKGAKHRLEAEPFVGGDPGSLRNCFDLGLEKPKMTGDIPRSRFVTLSPHQLEQPHTDYLTNGTNAVRAARFLDATFWPRLLQ